MLSDFLRSAINGNIAKVAIAATAVIVGVKYLSNRDPKKNHVEFRPIVHPQSVLRLGSESPESTPQTERKFDLVSKCSNFVAREGDTPISARRIPFHCSALAQLSPQPPRRFSYQLSSKDDPEVSYDSEDSGIWFKAKTSSLETLDSLQSESVEIAPPTLELPKKSKIILKRKVYRKTVIRKNGTEETSITVSPVEISVEGKTPEGVKLTKLVEKFRETTEKFELGQRSFMDLTGMSHSATAS